MYVWVHVWVAAQKFPEYHGVQLKKGDKERETFLVIVMMQMALDYTFFIIV